VASQRKAVAILTQLGAEAPGRRDYAEGLQAALSHLGLCLYVDGRRPEAEAVFRQALAVDDLVTAGHLAAPVGWKPWPAGRMYAGRGIRVLARLVAPDRPEDAEALFRRSLARLELWSREYPPDAKGLHREIVASRHDLVITLKQLGKEEEAASQVSELTREAPDDPLLSNALAWFLATADEPRHRDPARAVALARAATAKAPQNPNHWNTLGVALYRAGDWKAAIEALEKSREMKTGGDAFDLFFLAMARWQNGEPTAARAFYDKAIAAMDAKRSNDRELIRFRAEADALIRPWNRDNAMPSGPDAFVH
jgi:tetratricopeptide (TPR) repeat protein